MSRVVIRFAGQVPIAEVSGLTVTDALRTLVEKPRRNRGPNPADCTYRHMRENTRAWNETGRERRKIEGARDDVLVDAQAYGSASARCDLIAERFVDASTQTVRPFDWHIITGPTANAGPDLPGCHPQRGFRVIDL